MIVNYSEIFIMKKKFNEIKYKGLGLVVLLAVILIGCVSEPTLWNIKSQDQVITDYVLTKPEQYGEFGKLIESTGLTSLLSVRGPFTLFLPDDEAMKQYYKEHNISSLDELSQQAKIELVYNHLVPNEIGSGDILLGALRDTNALGDYLVTEFSGSDIIVNKQAKIVKRDIETANGYIHLVDHVIDPVTASIYDKIASDPSYSLFTKGLEITGLKDTLQLIKFPYGKKSARTRFTLLAVPDTTYNRYGIHSISELIARYTNAPDSVTFLRNGFYRYMEYHCLAGTFYLSDFKTKLYPILSSDNNVSVTIDTDYKLNYDKKTTYYTGFNVDLSNVPSKNGAIHSIKDLLPVIQPDPVVMTIETTDYFDMKQGDYFGKYYKKWGGDVGLTQFEKIKYEGDYLQYYYKNHDTGELLNDDCLNMNGFWWIEITTPKVMRGSYRVTANLWSGQMDYEVYIDGVKTATVSSSDPAKTTSWGEFTWTNTVEHKIKIVNISWGLLFWDTVIFTPIK